MSKHLHLDPFSGISGDMFLGALLDLGWNLDGLNKGIASLGMPEEPHVHASRKTRASISGIHIHVHAHGHGSHAHSHSHDHDHHHDGHGHGHHHHHEEHGHHGHGRSYTAIRKLIESSPLPAPVKERSVAVFRRIGEAEAKIHNQSIEEIHFHEVGAVDSIVDIVGVCLGLHELGIVKITSEAPADGHGSVQCAHGVYPVPAPATLELLAGIPVRRANIESELITPTGAALLAEFVSSFGVPATGITERTGYGLGTKDFPNRPNVLRARLLEPQATDTAWERDEVAVLETNIDDLSGEVMAHAATLLMEAGALDVSWQPIQMKKGRPAARLEVICLPDVTERLAEIVCRETSAFGLRVSPKSRLKLSRTHQDASTPWGTVRVKIGKLGDRILQVRPEYEEASRVARGAGVPLTEVMDAAVASARRALAPDA